jgi:tRNA-2-methylthio-N6-dimethylallyladenosine synthase
MRRGYTVERYLRRWEMLMERCPEMEIHSDWIVGYPGETEADFQETVEFMERVKFAQSYVFKYSPRPGTLAADLPDDVSDVEKARRNQVLLAVQERHTRFYNDRLIGTVQEVLVEGPSKRDASRFTGRTAHHRLVHFATADQELIGSYVPVEISEAAAHSLIGELLPATHRVSS